MAAARSDEIDQMISVFKGRADSPHLSSRLGAGRYVKMADEIKKVLPAGKILDWGAGAGQMTYLLKNRGLDVVSFEIDLQERPLLEKIGQEAVIGRDPVHLPFADNAFDAVLSSGVLEHVVDDQASLKEIHRILKPGGYFFVFMLPNRFSYVEFISDRMGRGDHPVKYTVPGIRRSLSAAGFRVLSSGYQNFFPYNLKGFPKIFALAYHFFDPLIGFLDGLFTALPLIRGLSTNLKMIAVK